MPAEPVRSALRAATVGGCGLVLGSAALVLASAAARGTGDLLRAQQRVIDYARWTELLANTAVVVGTAVTAALVLGAAGGLLAGRCDLPGRRGLTALLVLAACVPIHVAMVFLFALWPASSMSGSTVAAGAIYGIYYVPLCALLLAVGWRSVPGELEDLARLDADWGRVLLRVTLRCSWRFVAAAGLLIGWLVATDFTVSDLLGVRTFAEETLTQYVLHGEAGGPLVSGLPLLLVLAALLLVGGRRVLAPAGATGTTYRPPAVVRTGRGRWWLAAVVWAAIGLACAGPAWSVAARIGSLARFVERAWGFGRTVLETGLWAALAAAVIVLTGLALVGALRGRWWWLIGAILVGSLALPGPVVGITLNELTNRPGWLGALHDGPALLVIAYVVRFLALGVLALSAAARQVPVELDDHARLDGADWLTRLRVVYWPPLRPAAAVTWLVVVILCFGEIAAAKFVVAPGWDTVSVLALGFLHARVDSNLAVLAVLSVVWVAGMWAVGMVLLRAIGARQALRRVVPPDQSA